MVRALLHPLIKVVVLHKISAAVLTVLVLGFFTVGMGRLNSLWGMGSAQASSFLPTTTAASTPATTVNPSTATEQYLRGSQQFDAKMIWESLGDDVRATAQARGETADTLQERLDQTKASGGRVEAVRYIGGFVPERGDAMYFYVVTMLNPTVSTDTQNIFYVFTVGGDGKIKDIQ